MRQIKVVVPDDDLDDALVVLDEEGLDHVVTRDATTEDAVLVEFPLPTQAVEDVLSSPQYEEIELIRVRADVGVGIGPGSVDGASVTVVTTRPADTEYPDLAARLADAIAAETGREVAVVVEFTDLSRAPPPSASDAGSSRGIALPRRGVDAGGVEGMHPGTGIG